MVDFEEVSNKVSSRVIRHSTLAWVESVSDLAEKPDIVLRCTVLLEMKGFAMLAGHTVEFGLERNAFYPHIKFRGEHP
jgi:hypothetical protein